MDQLKASLGHPQQPHRRSGGHLLQPGGEDEGRERHLQRVGAGSGAELGQPADLGGPLLQGQQRRRLPLEHGQQPLQPGTSCLCLRAPADGLGMGHLRLRRQRVDSGNGGGRVQLHVELGVGERLQDTGTSGAGFPELLAGRAQPWGAAGGGPGAVDRREAGAAAGCLGLAHGAVELGLRQGEVGGRLERPLAGGQPVTQSPEGTGQVSGESEDLPVELVLGCSAPSGGVDLAALSSLGPTLGGDDRGRRSDPPLVELLEVAFGRAGPAGIVPRSSDHEVALGEVEVERLEGERAQPSAEGCGGGHRRCLTGLEIGHVPLRALGLQTGAFLVVGAHALVLQQGRVGVLQGATDGAGCVALEGERQPGNHRVDAGRAEVVGLDGKGQGSLARRQVLLSQHGHPGADPTQLDEVGAQGGEAVTVIGERRQPFGSRARGRELGDDEDAPGGKPFQYEAGRSVGGQSVGLFVAGLGCLGDRFLPRGVDSAKGLEPAVPLPTGGQLAPEVVHPEVDIQAGAGQAGPGHGLGTQGVVAGPPPLSDLCDRPRCLPGPVGGVELGSGENEQGLGRGQVSLPGQHRDEPLLAFPEPVREDGRRAGPVALGRRHLQVQLQAGHLGLTGVEQGGSPPERPGRHVDGPLGGGHGVGEGSGQVSRLRPGRDTGHLGHAGHHPAELGPRAGDLLHAQPATGRQPDLDVGEPLGAKELLQDSGPVDGGRPQELGEVPLRQQHHLEELLGGHADQVGDLEVSLPDAGRDADPVALDELLEQDAGRLDRRAAAASLGALLLGGAGDPHAAAGQGHLELHLGAQRGIGLVGAQPLGGVSDPRDAAEQGEAEPVEQRRLSRARRPVQQEQTRPGEGVEVDGDGGRERPEGGEPKQVRSHARTSRVASTASPRRATSAGEAGVPRTWSTKAEPISRSVRPATRVA